MMQPEQINCSILHCQTELCIVLIEPTHTHIHTRLKATYSLLTVDASFHQFIFRQNSKPIPDSHGNLTHFDNAINNHSKHNKPHST